MSVGKLERCNLWVGLLLWLGLLVSWHPHPLTFQWPLLLVAFGAWVAVPMVRMVHETQFAMGASLLQKLPARLQIPAAVALMVSVQIPPGWMAAALAVPWLAVTCGMALTAVKCWRWPGTSAAGRLALVGWLQIAIGGAWLVADRLGCEPFGFDGQIVRLTAAHFHFAGLVVPLIAGLVFNHSRALPVRVCCIGSSLGVLLVALGITLTRMGVAVAVECLLAATFSLLVLGLGLAQTSLGLRFRNHWMVVSGVALVVGMAFALLYSLRLWIPLPWLHIPRMWALHGTVQVFGFALPGLIGWLRQNGNVAG